MFDNLICCIFFSFDQAPAQKKVHIKIGRSKSWKTTHLKHVRCLYAKTKTWIPKGSTLKGSKTSPFFCSLEKKVRRKRISFMGMEYIDVDLPEM